MAILGTVLAWPPGSHGDPARGERVFQRCYAWHSVVSGEHGLPGPNLHGVLGRRAGTLREFRFSLAMVEAGTKRGLVWTRATLDQFLADPQRVVPGNEPTFPDADDRHDMIDYLEQASAPRSHRPDARPSAHRR